MPVTLFRSAADLDDETLQKLMHELSRDLRNKAGTKTIPEKESE